MAVIGVLLGVLFVIGMVLAFIGVATVSSAIAAPFVYHANVLDLQNVTLDYFGGVPGVSAENAYVGAAFFTALVVGFGVAIGALGALLMMLPALVY